MKYVSATDILSDFKKTVDNHFVNSLQGTIILIPSFEPDKKFINYVQQLKNYFSSIVVVNDGSKAEYQPIFDSINQYDEVQVIGYNTNKGKGYALKHGYKYINDTIHDYSGIITVDCDGQHLVEDVYQIAEQLNQNNNHLIFGCRDFTQKHVPFKSRIGNTITSILIFILYGKWLSDTQTGLRAFKKELTPFMLEIPGERFEYETQVLISAIQQDIQISTYPIQTIYENNNAGTHYQVLEDSKRISKVLFGQITRFLSSSLLCSLIDIISCWILLDLFSNISNAFLKISIATCIARIISMLCNFIFNKKFVFKTNTNQIAIIKYLVLALTLIILSSCFVYLFSNLLHINAKVAKPIVDSLLFIFSYNIQKTWVFKEVA